MAYWKRPEDILKEIEVREQIHGLVEPKVPKPEKYRRDIGPEKRAVRGTLQVGSKIIMPINDRDWDRSTIKGYALGVVLDFTGDVGSLVWSREVIVQVIKVTNEDLRPMVGHLRCWRFGGYSDAKLTPDEVDQADYKFLRGDVQ